MSNKILELGKNQKILFAIIGFIIALIMMLILSSGSKSDTFLQLLEEERYQEAEKYYENVLCKNEKEMQNAYESAIKKMQEQIDKYNREESLYEDAYSVLQKYDTFYFTEVKEFLAILKNLKASKEAYHQAENYLSSSNCYDAFRMYLKVIEMDERFSDAQSKLGECSTRIYSAVLSECERQVREASFLGAIYDLEASLSYFRNEDLISAREKINEYVNLYAQDIEQQVEGHWREGDYAEGFNRIEIAISNVGTENALVNLKRKYIEKYEAYITECVNTYKASKAYTDAAILLNTALQILPDSNVIANTYQNLKKYLPVELASIKVLEGKMSGRSRFDMPKDFIGNEYTYGIRYWVPSVYDSYVEYDLEYKYKYLTCIITPSEKWSGKHKVPSTFIINIWGDDRMLFERNMTRESSPIEIEINVAEVKELKITFDRAGGYYDGYFLFANAYLYEEYDK